MPCARMNVRATQASDVLGRGCDGQYNVRPAERTKFVGDVGLRRMERRRMRAKLQVCVCIHQS